MRISSSPKSKGLALGIALTLVTFAAQAHADDLFLRSLRDTTAPKDIYRGLRDMALKTTARDLQLPPSKEPAHVYGVVMDRDMGQGSNIITIVAFQTGDASVYLSSGGGYMGGRGREAVRKIALEWVSLADNFLDKAKPVKTTPLPDAKCIRFYLLTNKGLYAVQEEESAFRSQRSYWMPMFIKGSELLSAFH